MSPSSPLWVKKAEVDTCGSLTTGVAFEPQTPNAVSEILTTNEPQRDKPTPAPITLKNTETASATDLEMIFVG